METRKVQDADDDDTEDCDEGNCVSLGHYLSWIKNEMDKEIACLELPFTIVMLISFSCLAYLHLQQSKVFVVEGALRFDVQENANFAWSHNFGHKTVFDVNSIPDFWSWLRLGFLPLLAQHSWGYSEALDGADTLPTHWSLAGYGTGSQPLPVREDYLRYHRLLGGVRLRQELSQASVELCRPPAGTPTDRWRRWLGKPCLPAAPAYELTPEPEDAEIFGSPQRVEWLLLGLDSQQQLRSMAIDMEDGCSQLAAKGREGACLCTSCAEAGGPPRPWLDERSQRVEIGFISYNSDYGLYSLVTVNFFFSRGGKIRKLVHVQSSWANDFDRPFFELVALVACDLVWVLCLSYILISEVSEVIKTVRSSKQPWYMSLRSYIGLWNTVDWMSIACAFLLVAMFLRQRLKALEVNAEFERIATPQDPSAGRAQRIATAEAFFELVDVMTGYERIYRTTLTVYPMVVMARLFKSFDAQPRLAVVTRTLVNASSDVAHFFLIFLSVYFCMVVNSVLLFGQDMEDFATLHRATITCFQMMFEYWDYDRLKKVGLEVSAIWLRVFVIVVPVLLLNMLLAILMDAYGEVKSHVTDSRTLFTQISEILRRRRQFHQGQRVRLTDVWAAFFKEIKDEEEMLESKERMTPERVIDRVPGMKMAQATRTLRQARDALEKSRAVPYTQDRVKASVDVLDSRTRLIRDEVRRAKRVIEIYEAAPGRGAGGRKKEPRQQVVEAVRGVVGQLSQQISETLTQEGQQFENRQQALASQQGELLVCARDAHGTFQQLRTRSDEIAQSLQRHLLVRRRQQQWQRRPVGERVALAGLAPWTACVDPVIAPAQMLGQG